MGTVGRRLGKVEESEADHQDTGRDVDQGGQGTPPSQWEWGGKHGLEVEQGRC